MSWSSMRFLPGVNPGGSPGDLKYVATTTPVRDIAASSWLTHQAILTLERILGVLP
jgi:hypothetical protein